MFENQNIETKSMLPVGTLLQGGKYRIDRYLSSGGFGNTYVATNIEFDEQVAIKEFFMRGISEREDDFITVSVSNATNVGQFVSQKDKFRKEARRLRKLRNDHIVAVHDLFEENGTAYYEMDLIKGESLSERLKRTGQTLTENEVLSILNQVLDALAVVHEQGIYHLDLKPANIMIDQRGRALLIDFGASKQMHTADGASVSTSSALAFTPGYAPLEQTEQNIKNFGPWTDFYALGATLYKLLTNLTPPSASEILMAPDALFYPVPVSQRMQQLIAWMMKPRCDERPQNVAKIRVFLGNDEQTHVMNVPPVVTVYAGPPITDDKDPFIDSSISGNAVSKPSTLSTSHKSRSQRWIIVPLIIIAGLVGVRGLFYFLNNSEDRPQVTIPTSTEAPVTTPIRHNSTSYEDDEDDRPSLPQTPLSDRPTTTTPSRTTTTTPSRTTTTTPSRTTTTTTHSRRSSISTNQANNIHNGKVTSSSSNGSGDPETKINSRVNGNSSGSNSSGAGAGSAGTGNAGTGIPHPHANPFNE